MELWEEEYLQGVLEQPLTGARAPFGLRLLLLLSAGVAFGVLVSAINAMEFAGQGLLSKLLGGLEAWIVLPYAIAWPGRGAWAHFWRPFVFIESAVITYYVGGLAWQAANSTTVSLGLFEAFQFGAIYTVAALAMCVTFWVLIPRAKGTSRWRTPAALVIPILVAGSAISVYADTSASPGSVFYDPSQRTASLLVSAAGVLAIIAFVLRPSPKRVKGASLRSASISADRGKPSPRSAAE